MNGQNRRTKGLLVVVSVAVSVTGLAASEARLSLADSLRMALENNLDITVARVDPSIAEESVDVERAVFDPVFSSGASYFEDVDEPFNPSNISEQTAVSANSRIEQQLPFGASYNAQLSASKFDASAPLFTIESAYNADLDINFTLPLLRGRGREVASEGLILARRNLEISREDFRAQVHLTLQAVENAYWDVVAARQALGVSQRKLTRANDLLELNKKKVEVGTLAPIEITQAEAGVASNEEDVIVAETALENAEDELLRLLGVGSDDPLWVQSVVPTDQPDFKRREIELASAIDEALNGRPELASARKDIINKELSQRVAKRNLRPDLTLNANINPKGNNRTQDPGPDGVPNTFDDISVVSGALSEALSEITDAEIYDAFVSLNFSIPIGNRAAKAGYAIAGLNLKRAQVGLENQEQSIRVEVRRAVREVESGNKRVDASRANVVLQRRKLEAEQKKFDNGMSTSFEVLTFQNDLADAELGEIRALVDYNKALVELERVKGTLLEARGLSLAP